MGLPVGAVGASVVGRHTRVWIGQRARFPVARVHGVLVLVTRFSANVCAALFAGVRVVQVRLHVLGIVDRPQIGGRAESPVARVQGVLERAVRLGLRVALFAGVRGVQVRLRMDGGGLVERRVRRLGARLGRPAARTPVGGPGVRRRGRGRGVRPGLARDAASAGWARRAPRWTRRRRCTGPGASAPVETGTRLAAVRLAAVRGARVADSDARGASGPPVVAARAVAACAARVAAVACGVRVAAEQVAAEQVAAVHGVWASGRKTGVRGRGLGSAAVAVAARVGAASPVAERDTAESCWCGQYNVRLTVRLRSR
ncbi:hypothetical protein GGX14DRAFT_404904 [Mycena pura]|uniref:Uncharacterized protein n=1 Tax=Mycena pura TaxID=153505 RepID=A0AAD6UUV9_9AGAR|nr:hypothetical protein GGX14DRAFT_404904 [Mycena pura]